MSRRSVGCLSSLVIAIFALAAPASAFWVSPELGGDAGLTTPIVDPGTGAWDEQIQPRAASNGAVSLVVWSERDATGTGDIWGARVDADGAVIDPGGFPIYVGPGDQRVPDVAWDGEGWFVVWESRLVDYGDIYGIRVGANGVVDPEVIPIVGGWGQHGYPSVAYGAGDYLVAWHGPDSAVNATFVSRAGTVYQPGGFPLVDAPQTQTYPDIAYAPASDTFLVVWADHRRTPPVAGYPFSHEWPPFDVYGMRLKLDVSSSPVLLDSLTGSLPIHVGDQCDRRPRVDTDGMDFLVVDSCVAPGGTWNGTDQRMTALTHRVTAGGSVGAPAAVSLPGMDAWGTTVAWTWPGFVVAWVDGAAAPPEIRARRVSIEGAPTDGYATLVASGARFALEPPPPDGRLLFTSHVALGTSGARDALVAYGRDQEPQGASRVRARLLDLDRPDPLCTLLPGAIGCYTFDGDVLDHSGNLHHGSLQGAGSWVAGKLGAPWSALRLDGTGGYVSVADESAFDLGELSISAMVRVADLQRWEWIVTKGPSFGNFTLLVYGNDTLAAGEAGYVHQTPGGNWSAPISSGPLAANEWVHLLVTLSPTEFRSYLNGALQAVAIPAPPLPNDAPVTIGGGGYYGISDFFTGDLDALVIYGRTLTGAEVCELHNAAFNAAPIAEAGPDQAPTLVGSTIALDGGQSWDPDGDPLAYRWSFVSRPAGSAAALAGATTATPTFVADVNGTYVIRLAASDPCLEGPPDTVTVSFLNVAPVADAGASRTVVVGDTVILDGSGSSDANGDPLAFQWTLAAPPWSAAALSDPAAAIATFVPDLAGTYAATLVVSDGIAASVPATIQIEAVPAQTSAIDAVHALQQAVAILTDDAFKNPNMRNALLNKLNAIVRDIEAGRYADALDKLEHDVLGKTDGCAAVGEPDRNDWLRTCAAQASIQPLVLDLIAILAGAR